MKAGVDFSDLMVRSLSAAVMLVVGLGAVLIGGDLFGLLLIVAIGLMGWEISTLHTKLSLVSVVYGVMLSATLLCLLYLPWLWAIGTTVLSIIAAVSGHRLHPLRMLLATVVLLAATAALALVRSSLGMDWTLWLILVVVATDVGGYFAGKMIGGPKLWVRISPKKTWSGTLGGWILAAIVGGIAFGAGLGGAGMIGFSVLVAIASQIGDLAESAVKRQAGVKDSSRLIPGHGGLLDRFDGLLGASLLMGLYLVLAGPAGGG
jgi:phosphatidate cytidylyltransferase